MNTYWADGRCRAAGGSLRALSNFFSAYSRFQCTHMSVWGIGCLLLVPTYRSRPPASPKLRMERKVLPVREAVLTSIRSMSFRRTWTQNTENTQIRKKSVLTLVYLQGPASE